MVKLNGTARLRVGLDYRPALLSRAGIARSVRELAVALEGIESVDARLFGHSFARCRVARTSSNGGLRRLPIPGRSLPILRRFGLGADRLCGGADVFHWTDYVYPPLSSARAVISIHDVSFAEDERFHGAAQSRSLLARCRAAADEARRIVTPTRATADAVTRWLGVAPDQITVIPFGAEHATRHAAGPHPRNGRPFILALGTIEPRKNHARLIQAWRSLDRPRPDLVVIGRAGWECEHTVRLMHEARTEGLDWIQDADDAAVANHLQHAELLAYPSLLEGFGFPPLEALAVGTPVVAGDTPALREVASDAAEFCDPQSVESIHERLRCVLGDAALRHGMRSRGLQHAREFRWSDCAAAHARVYQEAAA